MTYQTFWPTSLPRQAPEYASDAFFAGLDVAMDAGIAGGGSLEDGSDATYVSLFNDVTGPAGNLNYGSLVAVDFAPMPNINDNGGSFYSLGITCRLLGNALDARGDGSFVLYDHSGFRFYGGRFSDFLASAPLPINAPTTATSAPDEDLIPGSSTSPAAAAALTTDGFTCVMVATDWTDYATGPFETWRIFEWGLIFDILTATRGPGPAPCRLYPRDDDLGVGAGHVWPPPRTDMPGGYI